MILCSSGVLFEKDRPHPESILALAPKLPAEGIEVLVTRHMVGTLDAAAERLSSVALDFPVVHAPKRAGSLLPGDEGVVQLSESVRFAHQIGADLVVLHLWDLPEGDTNFATRLDAAVVAADIAADAGVAVAIETIPCLAATPLVNVERALEQEPRLTVALDTEFLAYHDELEPALRASWLWADGVVRHIHLKDYVDGLFGPDGRRRYRALGEGTIDFPAFFDALEDLSYGGAVSLECAPPAVGGGPDVDAISRSLSRISRSPWSFV